LKPSNIMLTKTGAKLMDFGLAKRSGTEPVAAAQSEMTAEQSKLTGNGMLVGTFQYMAPEQLEGKQADARTDIFALGEVLYEMATGKPAFSGKSRASLIASILTTEPPPIALLQPLTPPALERIVAQCLAKDPDERWQSAHDLASELRWIVDAASQPDAAGSGRTRTRRSLLRWLAPAIAAAGLAAAGLVVALFLRAPEKKPGLRVAINLPAGNPLLLVQAPGGGAGICQNTRPERDPYKEALRFFIKLRSCGSRFD
jgi:serine/threonine protein kinase